MDGMLMDSSFPRISYDKYSELVKMDMVSASPVYTCIVAELQMALSLLETTIRQIEGDDLMLSVAIPGCQDAAPFGKRCRTSLTKPIPDLVAAIQSRSSEKWTRHWLAVEVGPPTWRENMIQHVQEYFDAVTAIRVGLVVVIHEVPNYEVPLLEHFEQAVARHGYLPDVSELEAVMGAYDWMIPCKPIQFMGIFWTSTLTGLTIETRVPGVDQQGIPRGELVRASRLSVPALHARVRR